MKTYILKKYRFHRILLLACIACTVFANSQQPLLLNGGFEDINTCVEYNSECGVEGWFYLKDVKAQMIPNNDTGWLGSNSFALSFNWKQYTSFSPLIGTILPCRLQKDRRYTFKGVIRATLNNKLLLTPGIALGERFYVPRKAFAASIKPDSITQIEQTPQTSFFQFQYSFVATGNEKYLTFGTFIEEDKTGAKKQLVGTQTISILLDNFQLQANDSNEVACDNYDRNAAAIYRYDFRHKEMDYSLYGKGEIPINLQDTSTGNLTRMEIPIESPPKTIDTLKLGDVFFGFNKATLTTAARGMLEEFFHGADNTTIDSIYIEGHTDSIGSETANIELSRRRCETLQSWLRQHTTPPGTPIHIRPFGKSRPIATNSTAAGRALNRRVELVIFRKR